jgi:hypothetical protein
LPREVGLYKEQLFPRCERCHELVSFQLLHAAPARSEGPEDFQIHLFELPVIEEAPNIVSSEPDAA